MMPASPAPAPAMKRRRLVGVRMIPIIMSSRGYRALARSCRRLYQIARARLPPGPATWHHRRQSHGRIIMAEIRTTPLFSVTLKVAEIQNLGKTPLGERRIGVVEGGSFEGPK